MCSFTYCDSCLTFITFNCFILLWTKIMINNPISLCNMANRFDVDQCDIWQFTRNTDWFLWWWEGEKRRDSHHQAAVMEFYQTGCINGTKICKFHMSQCAYSGNIRASLQLFFPLFLFICLILNHKRFADTIYMEKKKKRIIVSFLKNICIVDTVEVISVLSVVVTKIFFYHPKNNKKKLRKCDWIICGSDWVKCLIHK